MENTQHEHKKQLHDRITERGAQLKLTLAGLQADPKNASSERARAIEEALAALQTHVGGGWDSIDEQESAALTRWLESSRFLFDAPPTLDAPPPAPPVVVGPVQS